MMKITIKRLAACSFAVLLTLVLLGVSGMLLERKDSIEKNYDLIVGDRDVDVLFLGTSLVINGVYPMELWQDYGITSYNLGAHASPIPSNYWILMNALDYCNPKLVVVDTMMLDREELLPTNQYYMHQAFDAFALSPNKLRAVMDLSREGITDEDGNYEDPDTFRMELLWDFSIYHSRWAQLEVSDLNFQSSVEKGAQQVVDVVTPDDSDDVSSVSAFTENTRGLVYLDKIIEECQRRGIEVMLTTMATPSITKEDRMVAERTKLLAKEKNIPYLNLCDPYVINPMTDSYDETSHLNPSGARKTTWEIGAFIREHFDLPDHRGEAAYGEWDSDYQEYVALKANLLSSFRNQKQYLMLLSDRHLDTAIVVQEPYVLWKPSLKALYENLGIDTEADLEPGTVLRIPGNGEPSERYASIEAYCLATGTDPKELSEDSFEDDADRMWFLVKNNLTGEIIDRYGF